MLEKPITFKEGFKEHEIEKINVIKEKFNGNEGVSIGYLEIGTSSIAKILLKTFEKEIGSVKYGRISKIYPNDFKEVIEGLKENLKGNPLNIAISYLIQDLEYLLNSHDETIEGREYYTFEFIE